MRRLLSVVALLASSGCAREEMRMPAEPRAAAVPDDRVVLAVDAAEPGPEAVAPSRPRLDHVVTLGEVSNEPYTPPPSAPAPAASPVIINNNIVVSGTPGYYGYGYGFSSGYGRGGRARGAGSGTSGWTVNPELGTAAQAPPARPGQTPAIGGNWPTVPSYGPRQMR